MNITIGGLAGSYRKKAIENHRKLLEKGELEVIIDEERNMICARCGLVIDVPLDLLISLDYS